MNPIINNQLKKYTLKNADDEENALKEILQEVALFSLSTTDFFSKALFQGGTALRILYQLSRFSEDLDFILKKPTKNFGWKKYTDEMKRAFALYGIKPEIQDREEVKTNVKKMFLKDNSIGKILELNFHHHARRKLLIKFEIDINPPKGSNEERKYLIFPEDYSIAAQDLSSNFSGKCHALLCRQYLKGRDWFDFLWYVARQTPINFIFLKNAFYQNGPWEKKTLSFDKAWLIHALKNKITETDWKKAVAEVAQFTIGEQQRSLKLWNDDFFLDRVEKLEKYL